MPYFYKIPDTTQILINEIVNYYGAILQKTSNYFIINVKHLQPYTKEQVKWVLFLMYEYYFKTNNYEGIRTIETGITFLANFQDEDLKLMPDSVSNFDKSLDVDELIEDVVNHGYKNNSSLEFYKKESEKELLEYQKILESIRANNPTDIFNLDYLEKLYNTKTKNNNIEKS